ncbi:N-acyl amino acid synthase FeeM domain-containing protein [Sphingomonas limnosediminicola]|uniref:N-acyl amino acid synthase FeeM domain-containing protein n=1 Tax=Sphingomonas limnosediminicola TaxID=940133 RepID=UPI003CD065F9
MLNRLYEGRGYGRDHELPDPSSSVTFTACAGKSLVGTLTLNVDSERELAADRTFHDSLEPFRKAPGAKLCELTKFAFDTSTSARPRLAALFHVVLIFGSARFDCTDLFIEVNPGHRRFYEAMLGFTPVGGARLNESVNAPAQLMWLNVDRIREHVADRSRADRPTRGTLYSHFFSPPEENAIRLRLQAIAAHRQSHMPKLALPWRPGRQTEPRQFASLSGRRPATPRDHLQPEPAS